ncbi:hypothetical protein JIX59_16520 [Brevundimonas diminuta]|uniref:hypothetical protein n=1 Tax=Brevundimonas diminuta TaxID=293 RepID=UPI001907B6CE|nr:hypothetical protein [Brevundimonas diminuta]MBK1970947.1 hypothetical protein [Brevundimonas diminuta]
MFGLAIRKEITEKALCLLTDRQVAIAKQEFHTFIERFERTVIVLDTECDLILTKLILSDIDPSAAFLGEEQVRAVEMAARRKSRSYTPVEADAARARYEALKGVVISKSNQSAPAHKAWVTINEWKAAAQRGEWSHRWSVQFRLGTQMFEETQRAVHPRQAANAMARFVRDLQKSHHQVEVVAKHVEAV